VLEADHRRAERLRHVLIDVARHLAELHEDAFHVAELFRDLLGRTQGQVVTEIAAALDRREEELRRACQVAPANPQCNARQRRAPAEPRLNQAAF
jgi:hypothetical protein